MLHWPTLLLLLARTTALLPQLSAIGYSKRVQRIHECVHYLYTSASNQGNLIWPIREFIHILFFPIWKSSPILYLVSFCSFNMSTWELDSSSIPASSIFILIWKAPTRNYKYLEIFSLHLELCPATLIQNGSGLGFGGEIWMKR